MSKVLYFMFLGVLRIFLFIIIGLVYAACMPFALILVIGGYNLDGLYNRKWEAIAYWAGHFGGREN